MAGFKEKKMVLKKLREDIRNELKKLDKRIESAKLRMIDAPGAMQSHHDTTKVETGWLIDGFAKQSVLLEGAMGIIDRLSASMDPRNERETVGAYALVTLEDENGEVLNYLLLRNGQGRKVEHSEITATVIDPSTPLAHKLVGKEVGDVIEINGKELEITEII